MKKIRNRWLCALFVMAMLVNVTACGKAKNEETLQKTEPVKPEAEQNAKPEEQPEETKTESVSEEEVEILSTEETKTEDTPDQPSES